MVSLAVQKINDFFADSITSTASTLESETAHPNAPAKYPRTQQRQMAPKPHGRNTGDRRFQEPGVQAGGDAGPALPTADSAIRRIGLSVRRAPVLESWPEVAR